MKNMIMALWRVLGITSASLRGADMPTPSTKPNKGKLYHKARTETKNRGSRAGFPQKLKIKKVDTLCVQPLTKMVEQW